VGYHVTELKDSSNSLAITLTYVKQVFTAAFAPSLAAVSDSRLKTQLFMRYFPRQHSSCCAREATSPLSDALTLLVTATVQTLRRRRDRGATALADTAGDRRRHPHRSGGFFGITRPTREWRVRRTNSLFNGSFTVEFKAMQCRRTNQSRWQMHRRYAVRPISVFSQ